MDDVLTTCYMGVPAPLVVLQSYTFLKSFAISVTPMSLYDLGIVSPKLMPWTYSSRLANVSKAAVCFRFANATSGSVECNQYTVNL